MAVEQNVDLIVYETFFSSSNGGTIVDVGAARPDYLSISQSFRDRGWKVISIEPNPEFCAAHRAAGYDVLEYACSDEDADDVEFQVVNSLQAEYEGGKVSYESFSSLGIKDEFAALHSTARTETHTIRVKVRKLDTILRTHEPSLQKVDVLAIDVEGWELAVLRGFDLVRYRPEVVILENLFGKPEYNKAMAEREYRLWRRLDPNEVYVRER